jgi:hypothetical protein
MGTSRRGPMRCRGVHADGGVSLGERRPYCFSS